jgi:NADPH2:quinone reductase
MRAVVAVGQGGPDVLRLVERSLPEPGAGQILVRVAAAGVNRPDIMRREGSYPPPAGAPDVFGLELAGQVAATGPGASRFAVGSAVMGLVPGGAYADYALVHEANALPVPSALSLTEAGAVPETTFTVWTNVFQRAGLKAGETLLVHGGNSGIGMTAIQLARAFGARVIATASGAAAERLCRELGADRVVDYESEDFVAVAKALTDGRGVDVILDMIGGDYTARNHEAAAVDGRIAQIAFAKGQ